MKEGLPISQKCMEPDDEVLFIFRDVASLDVRPQVVQPPEPAAFTAPFQPWLKRSSIRHWHTSNRNREKCSWEKLHYTILLTCSLGEVSPFTLAVCRNVVRKDLVFSSRPRSSVESLLGATRPSPHLSPRFPITFTPIHATSIQGLIDQGDHLGAHALLDLTWWASQTLARSECIIMHMWSQKCAVK